MSDDRVSLRRFRAAAVHDMDAENVRRLLRELGPEGGDFVVLRAAPDRAEAIERTLIVALFERGTLVTLAGGPLCGTCGDREGAVCDLCGNGFVPPEQRRVPFRGRAGS